MSDTKGHVPLPYVKINGQIDQAMAADLKEMVVESSLHLPDVATITLMDNGLTWSSKEPIKPGAKVMIEAKLDQGSEGSLFDGEIVEIEQVFEKGQKFLIIRAFDRLHRLSRGRKARTFLNIKDSDLASQIASEVGLTADVEATKAVHKYVIQSNQSNLEFLRQRALSNGYLLYADGEKLCFKKPEAEQGPKVTIEWEKELSEFRPRMSTVGQVSKATVRGWDPQQKAPVLGRVNGSQMRPQIGQSEGGGPTAKKAHTVEAESLVTNRPMRVQEEAQTLAQAVADLHEGAFVEAEGLCSDPRLIAGEVVEIKNVGDRFSGKYYVTRAIHTFRPGEYETRFSVSGLQPATLLSMLAPEEDIGKPSGLVIGIVTNNEDPDKLGRIKVKYPWLEEQIESDWARIVNIGGGAKRGFLVIPEINDEVLIGFELDDFHQPYVLGGLWNGKDKPPQPTQTISSAVIEGGKVQQRAFHSRAGYEILFDEGTSDGKGQVRLKTPAGLFVALNDADKVITLNSDKHVVKLDDTGNVISVETKGDMTVNAQGKVSITGTAGINITSNAALSIEAKGNGTVSATGPLEVKSTAMLTVQGSLVKIN
jgi:phage protein D